MLTVLSISSAPGGQGIKGTCRCSCGEVTVTNMRQVVRGAVLSCGCYRIQRARDCNTKHGMRKTKEYGVWKAMHARCENRNTRAADNYINRGIRVCKRWKSFETFYADMGPRPSSKHSIDRIDNNKGYSKENCRWATIHEQANNKRTTRRISHNSEVKSVSEWDRSLGYPAGTINRRLYLGWSEEDALTVPINAKRKYFKKEAVSHE